MADKKKSFKLKISQNLAQLLIVMAGVFLGMLLTEWNTTRKTSNKIEIITEQIRLEILSNKALLESSIQRKNPFWKSLDTLNKAFSEEVYQEPFHANSFENRLPGWKGTGGGRLDDSMYETAKFSNVIPEMDFELVKVLSKAYNTQQLYNDLSEYFINQFYAINSNTTYADVLRLMWRIRQDLGGYELELLEQYELALQILDEKND
ncbi:hypothetical protein [Fulvivirga lutea]|uniref:Uncharacterized protein n=1 Tax=Fulvivirga lutea TaxID=2810512 RepID=A0A975A045_9BACT|nr:hypothetical protein [Fulvivirga lutea]QSE96876.1 hypothetical protein JR347_14940 [Fulvivirga lutea]